MAGNEAARIYAIVERFTKATWRTFVRTKLGLSDMQVEECEENYRGDMKEQRYQMVREWQISNGRVATIAKLEQLVEMRNSTASSSGQHQSTVQSGSHREQPNADVSTTSPVSTPSGDMPEMKWPEGGMKLTLSSNLQKRRESGSAKLGRGQTNSTKPRQHENGSGDILLQEDQPENGHINGAQPIPVDRNISNHTGGKAFANSSPGQSKKVCQVSSEFAAVNVASPIAVEDGKKSESVSRKFKKLIGWDKKSPQNDTSNIRSPPEEKSFCVEVKKVKVKKTSSETYQAIRKKPIYEIEKPRKGCVLILNNAFTSDKKRTRHGSQKDTENMTNLWLQLGCEIYGGQAHRDKSAEEMRKLLKKMTEQDQFSFIIIVIMTHGGKENGHAIFKGADDKSIRVNDIEVMFNNRNAVKLQNIPKFFIFQFCRGANLDKGVECDSFNEDIKSGMRSICPDFEMSPSSTVVETDGASQLPIVSDMLFAYATQPSFAALRHPQNGSWFINAITNVFMNHANAEDVDEMLTRVNDAMKSMSGTYEEKDVHGKVVTRHNIKAMSSMKKNLCKKLYLLPGY